MNWYKKAQIVPDIKIDMNSYIKDIDNTLFDLVEEPIDEKEFEIAKKNLQASFDNFIKLLHSTNIHDYDNILGQISNIEYIINNIDITFEKLWEIREEITQNNYDINILSSLRNVLRNFYILEKYLKNSYFTEKQAEELKNMLVSQSFENMNKIRNALIKLLSSVGQYKGKKFPITIEASVNYNSYGDSINIEEGTTSALLYVGEKEYSLYMSIYLDGEDIKILGDEVEDFNELVEEFGEVINDIKPFYNLVRMVIKNPNIEEKPEKIMTVYTARPITHFNRFENASDIPVDIFVSKKYNFVEGFAIDNKPKDIWRIRISDKYLITDESNNPDFIFQIYNPSGENNVPIKSIQFLDRIK